MFDYFMYLFDLYYTYRKSIEHYLYSFMQDICLENKNAFFSFKKISSGFVIIFLWMQAYLIIAEFKQ